MDELRMLVDEEQRSLVMEARIHSGDGLAGVHTAAVAAAAGVVWLAGIICRSKQPHT
jgi:hypothetical protein